MTLIWACIVGVVFGRLGTILEDSGWLPRPFGFLVMATLAVTVVAMLVVFP